MATYTVKAVKPTGKVDSTYGTEYHLKFNEDDRTVTASRKSEPKVGDEFKGEIKDGKFGAYFKKDPFVPNNSRQSSFQPAAKNNDGVRQGMCINNAAAYVNALNHAEGKTLTYDVWANEVYAYATALYLKGDLGQTTDVVVDFDDTPLQDPFAD